MSEPERVTEVLAALGQGDASAADRLLPLVYDELRRLAHRQMAREPSGSTLQATALVHEAYLRLVGALDLHWESRAHFFRAAALAMRRILVEQARRRRQVKRGGRLDRLPLEEPACAPGVEPLDVLALDEALSRLEARDKRKADVVHLRYFAGLDVEETAGALGISAATVKNDWSYARAWLHRELSTG
jgi:RNA polymerase sigma factor (TIGR02999 family)